MSDHHNALLSGASQRYATGDHAEHYHVGDGPHERSGTGGGALGTGEADGLTFTGSGAERAIAENVETGR